MTDIKDDPFLNPKKERLIEADGQNMYVPKAGFFDGENWSAGAGEGRKYTSYSLLSDLGLKYGDVDPIDTIELEAWNESHPYYDDSVDWDESLTLDIARNIYFDRAQQENYQSLQSRSTGGGTFARGLGIFGAAAFDPINLVAAPVSIYAKAGLAGKMALAGAANFVVEGALQGVAYNTQEVRSQALEVEDVALNLGMAIAIGSAFPAAGAGLKRLFSSTRASKLPTDANNPRSDYKPETKARVKIKTGHSRSTQVSTIANTNFNTIDSVKIDTTGKINTDEATVVVTKNNDNTITIKGSAIDLAKTLPALAKKLDDFDNVKIQVDELPVTTVTNAVEIDNIVKQLEEQVGVKPQLDKPTIITERTQFEGKDYEIEFDSNGDFTGVVYNVSATGKRLKRTSEKNAKAVIEANQQMLEHTRTKINNQTGSRDQALNNRTNRAGIDTVDSKLKNKENYKNQNEVDASVSGQSRDFINNYGNTETANKAWTAESVISSKNLYRAGYFIDENNELIDLTTTKVADLTSKQREILGRRLGVKRTEIPVDKNGYAKVDARGEELRNMINDFNNDMKANNQHKDSLREYVFCRIGAGTL